MFYDLFKFYGYFYMIPALMWLVFSPHRPTWEKFIYLTQTYHCLEATWATGQVFIDTVWNTPYYPVSNLFYCIPKRLLFSLDSFAAYLIIDSAFQIAVWDQSIVQNYLRIVYNISWSLAFYTITKTELGYFIVMYYGIIKTLDLINYCWKDLNALTVLGKICAFIWLWSCLSENIIYIWYLDWTYQIVIYGISGISVLNILDYNYSVFK